jgi:aldehyde dehydrogenase (NAD+)
MKKLFINGEWLEGAKVTTTRSPSDLSDVVGEYASAGTSEVEMAIAAASNAAESWRHSNVQLRADILDKIGTEINERKNELGTLLAREEGKTLPEAIGESDAQPPFSNFLRRKHCAFAATSWHRYVPVLMWM